MDVKDEITRYSEKYGFTYFTDCNTIIPKCLTDDTLEIARIFLLMNDYNISVAPVEDDLPDCLFYRILELTEKRIENINFQMSMINDFYGIEVLFLDHPGKYHIIFTEFPKDGSVPAVNMINAIFLGIDTLFLLDHQNAPRYKALMTDPKAQKSNQMFVDFFKNHNNHPENCLVISGSTLHAFGTTYTSDIDMFVINAKDFSMPEQVEYYAFNDGILEHPKNISCGRIEYWTETWPQSFGAKNLEQVLHDPRFYFTFLGAKFMSIKGTIQRLKSRAAPAAYVDLFMLKNVNDIAIEDICVPNSSIRKGTLKIYDQVTLQRLYSTMSKFFREWHGMDISIDSLKQDLKRCNKISGDTLKGDTYRNIMSHKDAVICSYIDMNQKILVINASDNIKAFAAGRNNMSFDADDDSFYDIIIVDSTENLTIPKNKAAKIITVSVDTSILEDSSQFEIRQNDDPIFGMYKAFNTHKEPSGEALIFIAGSHKYPRGNFQKMIRSKNFINIYTKKGYYHSSQRTLNTFSNDLSELENKMLEVFRLDEFVDKIVDPVDRPIYVGSNESFNDLLERLFAGILVGIFVILVVVVFVTVIRSCSYTPKILQSISFATVY